MELHVVRFTLYSPELDVAHRTFLAQPNGLDLTLIGAVKREKIRNGERRMKMLEIRIERIVSSKSKVKSKPPRH
jgi:hypothetical protein